MEDATRSALVHTKLGGRSGDVRGRFGRQFLVDGFNFIFDARLRIAQNAEHFPQMRQNFADGVVSSFILLVFGRCGWDRLRVLDAVYANLVQQFARTASRPHAQFFPQG